MLNVTKQGQPNDLIVTPETVTTAGAITYWRLSGSVSVASLAAEWKLRDLDEKLLPSEPSDEVAFRRAVKDLEEKRVLIRPLARRGKWAVVKEIVREGQNAPEYSTRVAISIDKEGDFSTDGVDASADEARELHRKVGEAYMAQRGALSQTDIAVWLVKIVEKLGAVSLRDSGGVYFIPRGEVETWRKVTAAIATVQAGSVFSIPAMKNSEAIDAITEALTIEGDKFAEGVFAELSAETEDDKLGDRALAGRAASCNAFKAKIAQYETLLGVKMDIVRERINKLDAAIATATLVAGREADVS